MGVSLPPAGEVTVSQALAKATNQPKTEAQLWDKVTAMCAEAGLPIGTSAPDFVISLSAPPTLDVFNVADEAK